MTQMNVLNFNENEVLFEESSPSKRRSDIILSPKWGGGTHWVSPGLQDLYRLFSSVSPILRIHLVRSFVRALFSWLGFRIWDFFVGKKRMSWIFVSRGRMPFHNVRPPQLVECNRMELTKSKRTDWPIHEISSVMNTRTNIVMTSVMAWPSWHRGQWKVQWCNNGEAWGHTGRCRTCRPRKGNTPILCFAA